jgi:hypothetical protein
MPTDKRWYTSDDVRITAGLRVMTNELRWGNVRTFYEGPTGPGGEYWDGWFDVEYDDGRIVLQNGERMIANPTAEFPTDPKQENR